MTARLIRVAILAVALLITALLVPDIEVAWSEDAEGIGVTLLILALVFGLVNAFIRPMDSYDLFASGKKISLIATVKAKIAKPKFPNIFLRNSKA